MNCSQIGQAKATTNIVEWPNLEVGFIVYEIL